MVLCSIATTRPKLATLQMVKMLPPKQACQQFFAGGHYLKGKQMLEVSPNNTYAVHFLSIP